MEIGISQLAFQAETLEVFFSQANLAGYDLVELSTGKESIPTIAVYEEEAAGIMELSQQYQLPIRSIAQGHSTGNLLATGKLQSQGIRDAVRGLELASKLGAGCTLSTLGSLDPELYYDKAYKNGIQSVREVAKAAEDLKVDFAVEFIWTGFLFSPLEMRDFLDEIGSSAVGFYFDPGNMAIFQYPHHWVRILSRRIKMMHMKDWNGDALHGDWPPLGKGVLDFKAIMGELKASGYEGPMISEVASSVAPIGETATAMREIALLY